MDLLADVAIVTACDSRYFKLVQGLIESILDEADCGTDRLGHNNAENFPMLASADFDVCMGIENVFRLNMCLIDCGLEETELAWLTKNGVRVVKPTKFSLVMLKHEPDESMFGFLERHNLPRLFPAFDIYMWMDADTWVQDYAYGILPYLRFAHSDHVAIVPEFDRCFAFNAAAIAHSRQWAIGNYGKFFGTETAVALGLKPMFNSGVFAARANSALWQVWESALNLALANNQGLPDFGIDQIALNYVLHNAQADTMKIYPLPATCNWAVTHAMPVRSDREILLTPLYPFDMIGVVHMMADTKFMRLGIERINAETGATYGGDAVHMDHGFWKKKRIAIQRGDRTIKACLDNEEDEVECL